MKLRDIFTRKPKQEEVKSQEVPTINTETVQKYSDIIEQIHREFETASDRLVTEAEQTIKQSEENIKNTDDKKDLLEKSKRLQNLGFNQSNQVSEAKITEDEISDNESKIKKSKEDTETVLYYKKNYPDYKFITEEQVETICKKYNLVCGENSRYSGFVPEKNLKEIEKFIKKYKFDVFEFIPYIGNNLSSTKVINFYNLEIREDNGYYHMYKKGTEDIAFKSDDGVEFYGGDKYDVFGFQHMGDGRLTKQSLYICAPIKDMDMVGLTIERGYKMKKIHIPDPVVLQPCRGGYVILTAWGDESQDPLVKNN